MIKQAMHNRGSRLLVGLLGVLLWAISMNTFVVPQGLYTGGLLGLCQVIRTVLVQRLGLQVNFDLSGMLYLLSNIPMFIIGWQNLGRPFVIRTIITTSASSLFLTLIPVPAAPVVEDMLTSCMLGGIICGFASGIILTCGCSTGGLDILGLTISKRSRSFTVGRFSIIFNSLLYLSCLLLFNATTAIYSAIYAVFSSLFVDRIHQQTISVQLLILTRDKKEELTEFILQKLDRGVTSWKGTGAYTGEPIDVLCTCLNKYELDSLRQEAKEIAPDAFFIVNEGVNVAGNFKHHLN